MYIYIYIYIHVYIQFNLEYLRYAFCISVEPHFVLSGVRLMMSCQHLRCSLRCTEGIRRGSMIWGKECPKKMTRMSNHRRWGNGWEMGVWSHEWYIYIYMISWSKMNDMNVRCKRHVFWTYPLTLFSDLWFKFSQSQTNDISWYGTCFWWLRGLHVFVPLAVSAERSRLGSQSE